MRWWIAAGSMPFVIGYLLREILGEAMTGNAVIRVLAGDLGWVFGFVAGAGILALRTARRKRRVSVDEDEVYVDVVYRSEGGLESLSFGNDEGVLCAVDGWLHFRGRNGEWSLSRTDAGRDHETIGFGKGDRTVLASLIETSIAQRRVKELLNRWERMPIPSDASTLPVFPHRWPWLHAIDAMFVGCLIMLLAGATTVALVGSGKFAFVWQSLVIAAIFMAVTLARFISRRRLRWARWQAAEPLTPFSRPVQMPVEGVAERV